MKIFFLLVFTLICAGIELWAVPRPPLSRPKQIQKNLEIKNREFLKQARSEFSKGDFHRAIQFYSQIPKNTREYLRSREELAWSYLQNGDWSALRGILQHLNSPIVPLEYRLEGRVLAAISKLQTCDFAEVEKQIGDFQTELRPVAVAVDQKLRGATKLKPATVATLKAKSALIGEAIVKMRFVKIELLSQLQRLERFKTKDNILSQTNQINRSEKDDGLEQITIAEKSKMVFLTEGDLWPDELFVLKGLSPTECHQLNKFKKSSEETVAL